MQHSEGTFSGVRNATIYYQSWLPDGNVKAVLLIVHGLGEHSGRYMNVVNRFVPLGYAVYALDHLGHGKSDGTREYVERFDDFTDTLARYYRMVAGWQPGKPIFLIGHSMGGLIATTYLLDHQADFRGAIISAPAIAVGANVSPVTIALGKVAAVLAPKLGVLALDINGVSRDPAVVQAYVADPLNFQGKTRFGVGYDRRHPVDVVFAVHVGDLVGALERLVDAAHQQRHAVYRIEALVRVGLGRRVVVACHLPAAHVDGLETGLHHLHRLVAGDSAQRAHKGVGVDKMP